MTRVSYEVCGETMAASSLQHHMERNHGNILAHTHGVDVGIEGVKTYVVSFPCNLKLVALLMEGCLERAQTSGRISQHFICRHWKFKIAILQEGPPPLPWCANCGMNVTAARMERHKQTTRCNTEIYMHLQRRYEDLDHRSGDI